MNVTINYNNHQRFPEPYQKGPADCSGYSPFQPSTGLGQKRPGIGSIIGGIVGAVIGQIMCPIPVVGAMLGGMIGSIFGGMLDNLFASSAGCCCHNMGQNYGPANHQMGYGYGYPLGHQDMLPPGFHNPHYGCAPPLFPSYEPPVAKRRLPQVSINPLYNHQHQRHHSETTRRSQTAVAIAGKNVQIQENTHGHNEGRQVAATVVGVNEQRQENVTGTNSGTQVAVNTVGANRQTQSNVHGNNEGTQVAGNVVGNNTQTQTTQTGNNSGSQTATTAVGVNTQTQETVTGDNSGNQTATTLAGSNNQTQESVTGDNSGRQTAVTAAGPNRQTQTTVVGDNSGNQTAVTVAGNNTQTQTTRDGDNSGNQTSVAAVGTATQTQSSGAGDNEGSQTAVSTLGGSTQTQTTVRGDNEGAQTASTLVGTQTQTTETVTGDNSATQTASTAVGNQTQSQQTVTGDNSGNQRATTVVGEVEQTSETQQGTNTGSQTASTVIGDTSQTSHAGEANEVTQEATTVVGDSTQVATGGDGSNITQQNDVGGESVQAAAAGENSIVTQTTTSDGPAVQEATIESGVIQQEGGNQQTAASGGGPVVVTQSGDRHGEAVQAARGSDAGDVITQEAGRGTLNLFDDNSTASADLGGGNDTYTYSGNSEMNHVRVNGGGRHAGPDRDTVRIDTRGGADTAVINLSGGRDNYQVDLGSGNDRLVVNESGQRIRITDNNGREIYRSEGWTAEDGTARVNGMENLSVYREDGSFARWDRRGGLQEGQDPGRPGEMSPVRAARLFREHAGILDTANGTGSVDGIIGRSDLRSALNNPSATPELREAINYALNNQSVWQAMDAEGAGGNRVNLSGLNSFIDGYETRPGYNADAPMNDRQAARVLNYHSSLLDTASGGGQNSKFNEDDLRAIAGSDNSGLPPELRSAARRLLNNDGFAGRVDDVSWESGGMFDGQRTFSNSDLSGFRG